MAFDLEEFLKGVRVALENNMNGHPDIVDDLPELPILESPLLLDKDFSVEIKIYAGEYDKENHVFVKDPDANYVGIWPIIHRE